MKTIEEVRGLIDEFLMEEPVIRVNSEGIQKFHTFGDFINQIFLVGDLEFWLNDVLYYIGAPRGELLIGWDNGEKQVVFSHGSKEEALLKLLTTKIKGFRLCDDWERINIDL